MNRPDGWGAVAVDPFEPCDPPPGRWEPEHGPGWARRRMHEPPAGGTWWLYRTPPAAPGPRVVCYSDAYLSGAIR